MKRILTLFSATAVMVLMFASAAPATVHLCSNHSNQQSAQAALDQDPSLAPTLDPDGDGVACEDFFGAMASLTATSKATASATPTATASPTATATAAAAQYKATVTALPGTGGMSPAAFGMGAAVLLLGGGLMAGALVRRS